MAHHLLPEQAMVQRGWAGVNIFFVLSGFLITSIILENLDYGKKFLLGFYLRRIFRIWPVYFAAIALVFLISSLFETSGPGTGSLPQLLTFSLHLQSWWGAPNTEVHFRLSPLWSVCVEEQFYLVWPALLLLLGRRAVPVVAIFVIGISSWARSRGLPDYTIISRGDGLGLGALLAWALANISVSGRKTLFLFLVGAGITGAAMRFFFASELVFHWAVNLCSLAGIGLCVISSGSTWLAGLRTRIGTYLGRISYGIYAYHMIAFWIIDGLSARIFVGDGLPASVYLAAKLALTFVFAAVSFEWMEAPLLRLKQRFPYDAKA